MVLASAVPQIFFKNVRSKIDSSHSRASSRTPRSHGVADGRYRPRTVAAPCRAQHVAEHDREAEAGRAALQLGRGAAKAGADVDSDAAAAV